MVRGARDVYSGGYHDEKELAAFTHGLDTAFAVLDHAAKNDTQTAANLNIGQGALAAYQASEEKP